MGRSLFLSLSLSDADAEELCSDEAVFDAHGGRAYSRRKTNGEKKRPV